MKSAIEDLKHGRTIMPGAKSGTKDMLIGLKGKQKMNLTKDGIEQFSGAKNGSNMKDYIKSNTQTYVPQRKGGLDYGIDFAMLNKNNEKNSNRKNKAIEKTDEKPAHENSP